MEFFGVIGIVTLFLSYLHFFRPNVARKIDEFGKNVVINMTQLIESHHIWLGIFYFVVGIALVYIGFLWSM